MKKILMLSLALTILAPAVFADDAMVMPAGVGRFYIAPNFSFAPGSFGNEANWVWDLDREREFDGNVQVFNLGFALEYGINSWITAAVQWVPGWTPWSNIEPASGFANSNTNGVGDIFAGAKFQLVGANAPVQSDIVRFAISAGAIIPLPGADFDEEFSNVMAGNEATLSNMDRHVFGAGARFHYDFIINDRWFINLFNETRFYPFRGDLNRHSPTMAGLPMGIFQQVFAGVYAAEIAGGANHADASTAANVAATAARGGAITGLANATGEVNYRYQLTFEIEPVFSTFIADGIRFTAGLPLTYRFTPAPEFSVTGITETLSGLGISLEDTLLGALATNDSHILSISPSVSVFFMSLPLPLEFKIHHTLPIRGRNTNATHTTVFQIRAYFAF